jgi:integrase
LTEDMPRKLPPYVNRHVTRHGKTLFYFRRGKGPRTPLPSPKDKTFDACYLAALAKSAPAAKKIVGVGSLEWLIARYRDSSAYRGLSKATRKQRDNIFKGIIEKAGGIAYRDITRKAIVNGREDRAATPAQARNYLDAVRGLFRWAVEVGLSDSDPTIGIKNPVRPKTKGFEIWHDDEVARYRATWPLGTRERVWLEVLIGTGARRGDAVTIGRQHFRNGMIAIETQKEGVWAYVPVLPTMREAVDRGPTGDLTLIVGATGRNLTKESFGNMFRAACRTAGVSKSAHGLRKYAATAYAEAGLSDAELESILGLVRGSAMAAHYSRNAERHRLAEGAAGKIVNAERPHLEFQSPNPAKKSAT